MGRSLGNKDFWLASLRADGPAFRSAVAEAPIDAPVPSCPEWTVKHLIGHLAGVYDFVLGHVERGVTTAPERRDYGRPPAGTGLLDWWDDRFAALLTTLDGLDPELPAWNWAPQAKKAGFWHRRMAHETAVHRWDAQFSLVSAEPIEAKLAVDGVAEVLDTWLPAGRGTGPRTAHGIVALSASDAEHEWHVRLRGQGGLALLDTDTLLDSDEYHERAVARGTASDLLLALYGRVGFDVLEITGDERLLEALRTG
ncbi:MAG TPA: maleylpyruvate isomerase family mycothiol-dependent enzyme [Rugosimonospora sp.]|nr:maleylpyruvate isomerase family mycothiol-dependent enzyme [Rugosimonospora sp.]